MPMRRYYRTRLLLDSRAEYRILWGMQVVDDEQVKVVVSANIKALLAKRELSQAQLAALVGVAKTTINSVVKGVCVPSFGLASRIAVALGVSTDALLYAPADLGKKTRKIA